MVLLFTIFDLHHGNRVLGDIRFCPSVYLHSYCLFSVRGRKILCLHKDILWKPIRADFSVKYDKEISAMGLLPFRDGWKLSRTRQTHHFPACDRCSQNIHFLSAPVNQDEGMLKTLIFD
jgi:hypothetical protein